MGNDFDDVAGVLFQIKNGVATFEANGKNKIGGAALFGSLVTAVSSAPLGFGIVKFRDAYRVCTSRPGCLTTAECASGAACIGGACVGLGAACSTSNDCAIGETCFNESCVAGVLCPDGDSDCTSPETCVNGVCTGQTVGTGLRCHLNSDCAPSTPTCADPGPVIACSTIVADSTSPCFAGTIYAKTGIKVGCDKTLGLCQ